ncbi:NusG domain II-containing protein [Acutalibacter sp. 1XD8-33]|uniref:NusG domain II-containing protein n=1 Tax=Acutalibacter sp. 1XD8-33 TaxID=2320081 RepID=UPI001313FE50|nr:NusG domain II-containing protein [Acutalibacter sp. 1XD8-33]
MNTKEVRLFSRQEWPFFVIIVLVAAGIFALQSQAPKGIMAVVEVEGQTTVRRDLAQVEGAESLPIAGADGIALTVEFSREGARVLSSTCPDKTCQRTGLLSRAGESAVCLPGRVVLRLEGKEDRSLEADAVTG